MDGILVINKPKGISSFGYMKKIQRKLGVKKMGHLGTLDPNASGVLVLLCGKATKRNVELSGGTKVYQSVFTFGMETDTLDPEGVVVATSDVLPTPDAVKTQIEKLRGLVEIEVPKFSAVHINGKRAYELARAGVDFVAPKKTVEILRFELLQQIDERNFLVELECQTGTYVRSMAKLLATNLGTLAIASEITRTRVGEFLLQNAQTIETVTREHIV